MRRPVLLLIVICCCVLGLHLIANGLANNPSMGSDTSTQTQYNITVLVYHHIRGHFGFNTTCRHRCTFTTNRTEFPAADAVIFTPYSWSDDFSVLPQKAHKKQIFLAYSEESNYLMGPFFNWTYQDSIDGFISYTKDSDIYVPFIPCHWREREQSFWKKHTHYGARSHSFGLDTALINRSADICAFISFCESYQRTMFFRQLKQMVKVDSFGQCDRTHSLPDIAKSIKEGNNLGNTIAFKREIMQHYPFALAFENCVAPEYVTEKIFDALEADTLPVYLGTSSVQHLLPCNNCFIDALGFSSPLSLTRHLESLIKEPQRYETYFDWKKKPLRKSWNEAMR